MAADAVILSHAGKQHAYRAAAALDAAGALRHFVTSSYYKRNRWPDRIARLSPAWDAWLRNRHEASLDADRVIRFPHLELPEVTYRWLFGHDRRVARIVRWRDEAFDRRVSRRLARWGGRLFWGFQGSCRLSLVAAKELGMTTVAEFPGIPERIARAYLEPDSGVDTQRGTADELEAADFYLAASSFSARCLARAGAPSSRIRVLPLGVDLERFAFRARSVGGPLKALFVGKLAPHKGIAYLLQAMRLLDSGAVTLSLVGPGAGADAMMAPYAGTFRNLGSLRGEALTQAFHAHDVLVLPSLYEGFGLVILEAMASGMPVVATENSCAPDVVRDAVDGFVVAPRDAAAIAARLEWCAGNRPRSIEMGAAAAARAADFSWSRYCERVGAFVREALAGAPR